MTKVVPSRQVSLPASEMNSSRAIRGAPTPMPVPTSPGHMSNEVRADTAKLEPSLRAGILRAADAK
jgi:hypothetical protein